MDRIDVLGPGRRRLEFARGRVLDPSLDAELQKIVEEAAELSDAPISLITLVLHRTQFFRAHRGLPPDLRVSQATDRSASFCQFVVRDGQAFEVNDATTDERIPKLLVARYGLRSYLGMPLTVRGQVAGSLCVLDYEARKFDDIVRSRLLELAERAERRLTELALLAHDTEAKFADRALQPTFQDIRNHLQVLSGHASNASVAALEIASLRRLLGHRLQTAGETAASILEEAGRSLDDLVASVDALEKASDRIVRSLLAIEKVVVHVSEAAEVAQVVEAATELSRHFTGLVGGIRWRGAESSVVIRIHRRLATSILSSVISEVADCVRGTGKEPGLDGECAVLKGRVELRIGSDGLTKDAVAGVASRLREVVWPLGAVEISTDDDRLVLKLPRSDE